MTHMMPSEGSRKAKRTVVLCIAVALLVAACANLYLQLADEGYVPDLRRHDYVAKPSDEHPWPDVDFEALMAENPEVVGYVSVPGTAISQVVCQSDASEPNKYLHVNWKGEPDQVGAAFLDSESEEGLMVGQNSPILGHHWTGDLMFSEVANYSDEAWARDHDTAYVQTPEAVYTVRLAFVEVINGNERAKRCVFEDDADFASWYTGRLDGADVVLDETVPSKVASLVTCSYNYNPANERTVAYFAVESVMPRQ